MVVDEPATSPKRGVAGVRPGAVRWVSYAVIAAILLALVGGGIAIAAVSTEAGTVAVPSLVGPHAGEGDRRGRRRPGSR